MFTLCVFSEALDVVLLHVFNFSRPHLYLVYQSLQVILSCAPCIMNLFKFASCAHTIITTSDAIDKVRTCKINSNKKNITNNTTNKN